MMLTSGLGIPFKELISENIAFVQEDPRLHSSYMHLQTCKLGNVNE